MDVFGHPRRWDSEVCILQAGSRLDLIERLVDTAAFFETGDNVDLKDIAFTLNSEPRLPLGARLAIVAESVSDLRVKLAEARTKLSDPRCRRIRDHRGIYFFQEPIDGHHKVAFLFPGEGAQYPHMLADICIQFPDARAWFDLMDRAFIDHERGYLPSELVFTRRTQDDPEDARIWNMDGAVETVFAANQALLTVLNRLGVWADMMVGHSSGDYSALLAAGCLAVSGNAELVQLIRALNSVYEEFSASGELPQTALLAVGSVDAAVVARLIDQNAPDITIALDNCPQQIVLCGTDAAIDRAARQLASDGAVSERLPFGRPCHTPLFASLSDLLGAFFDRLDMRAPTIEIYSCATAAPYPVDLLEVRKLAVAQWTRPVRFRETIEAMYEAGARVFVEVGPRGNLAGFVENTLRGRNALSIPTNTLQRSGLTQLNHAVGLLAAKGVPVNTDYLYALRAPRRVTLDGSISETRIPTAASVKLSLRLPRLKLMSAQIALAGASSSRSVPISTSPVLDSSPTNSSGSASAARSRTRVMQEYFNSMEQFLRVEREVLQAALARGARPAAERAVSRATESPQPTPPLIDRVVSIDPGGKAVAICELNVGEHRYLRDHTLGASVSSFEPDLIGLPVLPLAVSIEMLAEVASLLCPGLIAVGARNIRAHRWVVLESERLTLRITATVEGSRSEVRVEMHEDSSNRGGGMSGGGALVEATIIFADCYPPAEPADSFALRDESPSKWPAGNMYGRTGMFHGPAFQLVERIDRFGQDGAEATLVGRGCEAWLGKTSTPAFLMDPMVLDAMGQIVGYWIGDRFERGLSVFPVKLERLEVRARALAPGDRARCRVHVTRVSDDAVLSDIDVVAADGTLMVRMHQWEDRRLDLPQRLYDFRISPHEVMLSDEWPQGIAGLAAADAARACRLRIPRALLEAHGGIWLRVVAYLVLGLEERHEWHRLSTAPMQRRLDWLAGRIVAKDSVRLLLRSKLGLLRPCDIEIYGAPDQRPQVRGPWTQTIGRAPHVTIAHSAGEAVAIAIDGDACDGIGVDIEMVGRVGEVVRSAAFTTEEYRWLAALDEDARPEWTTRVWCAKEAVGKALGCGLTNGGQDLEVCEVDRTRGVVEVTLRGSLERECPDLLGKRIVVCTASEGTLVTAAAIF
jgi:malonyl CoA-acyl carrier protein transacylase/phosphopantetheinyl transferase